MIIFFYVLLKYCDRLKYREDLSIKNNVKMLIYIAICLLLTTSYYNNYKILKCFILSNRYV